MITQVEVTSGVEIRTYWLSHPPYGAYTEAFVKAGQKIGLQENSDEWTIRRTFVTLPDETPLPPKARVGTLRYICF